MKKIFEVEELCCAHCATKIEKAIKEIEGVNDATVSFLTQKIILDVEEEYCEKAIKEMVKVAKKIEPDMEILGL